MSFAPYLVFDGDAREAMTHYAAIFGAADLQIMDLAEAPTPPGQAPRVRHAQFTAGAGSPLLGSDRVTGMSNPSGSPTVFHAAPTTARATEIYADLSESGSPFMPLAPTFWSPVFGMLRDRFGPTLMITTQPGVTA